MSHSFNFISVNDPNIPILLPLEMGDKAYGEFTPSAEHVQHDCNSSLLKVDTRDLYLPNFSLREFKGVTSRDAVFKNHEGEGIGLPGSCVFFNANLRSRLPGSNNELWAYSRTNNFKYDPDNEYEHWVLANQPFHFAHLSYTTKYLNHILPENEPWAEKLMTRVVKKERIIGEQALPISILQEQALHTIFHCPIGGKLGEMIIESSIFQLVLLQLHGLFSEQENGMCSKISKRDAEVIHEVREYLSQNFLQDHSILYLSRHFGTNTNKLMHLFKKVFGQSIFEYITDLRMEHARTLLLDDDLRVIDIARTLGYKNPNHFSTAFKRKYGVAPSRIK